MDNIDKQRIYNIYRACRLCGAGAGYKMPIIQSVIDMDGEEIELKQKIRECVQIEVNNNDRMPPLICELCVDKINDFYDFRKMCQETNINTRNRLGLPPQNMPKDNPNTEDCILGVTKTVCINSDSDEEVPKSKPQLVKTKPRPLSVKLKKGLDVAIEKPDIPQPVPKTQVQPKRSTRQSLTEDVVIDDYMIEDNSLLVPRQKRPREVPIELPPPIKKTKTTSAQPTPDVVLRPGPKCSKVTPVPPQNEKPLPKAGPKSKKRGLSPTPPPQPKTDEITFKPGPKSRKKEFTPLPNYPEITLIPAGSSSKFSKELMGLFGIKRKKGDTTPKSEPKIKKKEEIQNAPKLSKELAALTEHWFNKAETTPTSGLKAKKGTITSIADPKAKKGAITPTADPKAKKGAIMPTADPQLKKEEFTPSVGSKKTVTPSAVSKAKKQQNLSDSAKSKKQTPQPSSKSKRPELSQTIISFSAPKKMFECNLCGFKTKYSKGWSSHLKRHVMTQESISQTIITSLVSQKGLECNICGFKSKCSQGLSSHLKTHAPLLTPKSQACNPCELWFPTIKEAESHHQHHITESVPYTCSKCYDDFTNTDDYKLHFERNQCITTYEVPDVKCDDCWRYFATYKLLEDHKCLGEDGRPGGRCSKCGKAYSLLRSLINHEMKCQARKKGTKKVVIKKEPLVDPIVSSKLLPIEVRIVKCDLLLKSEINGHYDVSTLSHRFGLDRYCTYPYLYSMGDVNSKTVLSGDRFNRMVSINDDIKEEYLNEEGSTVHWDSDEIEDSDDDETRDKDGELGRKSIDSLSKMSLNTIFSPKCLGKMPKKKRRIKELLGFQSVLSINFNDDVRTNIDKIINELENDAGSTDSYGSSSILEKNPRTANSSPSLNVCKGIESVNELNKAKNTTDDVSVTDNHASHSTDTLNCNNKDTENSFNNNSNTDNDNSKREDQTHEDSSKLIEIVSVDSSKEKTTSDSPIEQSNDTNEKLNSDLINGEINDNVLQVKDKIEKEKTETKEQNEINYDNQSNLAHIDNHKEVVKALDESCLLDNKNEKSNEDQYEKSVQDKNDIDTNSEKDSQTSDVINFNSISDLMDSDSNSQNLPVIDYKANYQHTDPEKQSDAARITEIDSIDEVHDANDSDTINCVDGNKSLDAELDESIRDESGHKANNSQENERTLRAESDVNISKSDPYSDVCKTYNDENNDSESGIKSNNSQEDEKILRTESDVSTSKSELNIDGDKTYNDENRYNKLEHKTNNSQENEKTLRTESDVIKSEAKSDENNVCDDDTLMADLDAQIEERESKIDVKNEINDDKLMAELDAQIGECDTKSENGANVIRRDVIGPKDDSASMIGGNKDRSESIGHNDSFGVNNDNDKKFIDNNLMKDTDLDSISDDEFDFDL